MGMLKFEVTHNLSKDEARSRVEALLDYWGKKYGVRADWNEDRATLHGKVMGIQIDANLRVDDARVGGEATDPGMLLRGKAQKYLTKKFSDYLDKSRSPADLARSEET